MRPITISNYMHKRRKADCISAICFPDEEFLNQSSSSKSESSDWSFQSPQVQSSADSSHSGHSANSCSTSACSSPRFVTAPITTLWHNHWQSRWPINLLSSFGMLFSLLMPQFYSKRYGASTVDLLEKIKYKSFTNVVLVTQRQVFLVYWTWNPSGTINFYYRTFIIGLEWSLKQLSESSKKGVALWVRIG